MSLRRVIIIGALAVLPLIGVVSPSGATTKPPVSVQIELNATTIRAGHSVHGTAIITNSSSASILVQGWSCDQWLYVGLANKHITYDPAVPTSACSNSVTLKPGKNRVPITLTTMYQVCGAGTQKGTVQVPHCTKSGMPALPKGRYHVVVWTPAVSAFAPYSASLHVTIT